MKRVPADEFAEHAAEYLQSDESLEIERDGQVLGRYVPTPHAANGTAKNGHATNGVDTDVPRPPADADFATLSAKLQQTLDAVYAETGLTEDELVDLLDPRKPFPYDRKPAS